MSKKVLVGVLTVASIVLPLVPGLGTVAAIGLKIGVAALLGAGAAIGASLLASSMKGPKTTPAATDRLSVSIDPRTPRKGAFGDTALNTDLRDQEYTGANKEYFHRFIVTASHKVTSYREIWFDDKLAWTATGGVQGEFAGYLQVTTRLEGTPENAINISSRMGNTRRFTGCSYVHLRYKLTGNSKKTESPFAQSVPTRVTIIGEGMPVYDPRYDSTVPGGNGPARADDQTTWQYSYFGSNSGRNPVCQMATYLLGWRIRNPVTGAWKLAVGKGTPKERIDWPSFITGANLCEEPVALAVGGTEPRYRSDGVFSEFDQATDVLDNLKAAMNAELDDMDGLIRVTVLHNDLAVPVLHITDDDLLGDYTWTPHASLEASRNVVRGSYVDPSPKSLYQMVPYPDVAIGSPDGIERPEPINYAFVQSPSQAQRLSKQKLQRAQYAGLFVAEFKSRLWKAIKNDVVTFTCGQTGFENKLFRVVDTATQVNGVVPVTLREEHPNIYLWESDERPAVEAVDSVPYTNFDLPVSQFLDTVETGANVTENHTSANTVAVGDRTAEAVNYDLDNLYVIGGSINYDISQILLDIDALKATYGSTASAEQSAGAAAGYASAAATAAATAATARDQAQGARDLAEGARETAVAAAQAAGGHASNASSYRDEAQGFASAAQGSATTANTKAGEASLSAGGAAQSETNAAGSASSAANSAVVAASAGTAAQDVANLLIPDRVAAPEHFFAVTNAEATNGQFSTGTAYLPNSTYAPGTAKGANVTVAGEGLVRQYSVHANLYTRGWLPIGTGRTFRVTFRHRLTVAAAGPTNRGPGYAAFTADGVYLTTGATSATGAVANGWETLVFTITSAQIIASWPTATYIRGRAFGGREQASNNSSGATWQAASLRIEDITNEVAAAASASAAAGSASTAGASQTAAGNSASAAQGYATTASTKADDAAAAAALAAGSASTASTKADSASQSATNAQGSAATATTQAENASQSATTAGGHASAASGYASTANTKAGEAGLSATAASGYRDTAQIKAGEASSSALSAANSAGSATTSAAAAFSSAQLSAAMSSSLITNIGFDAWASATGAPDGWQLLAGPIARVADPAGGYAVRFNTAANFYEGTLRFPIPAALQPRPGEYVVLEMEASLASGTWSLPGVFLTNNNQPDLFLRARDTFTTEDALAAAIPGRIYRWSKLIRVPTGYTIPMSFFGVGANTPNGVDGPSARDVTFYRANVRAATSEEIRSGTVIPSLQASVSVHAGAITTLQGRSLAYLQSTVNAGSAATAFVELRAEVAPGSVTSSVGIGAREVHVWTDAGGGAWKKTLSISGNDVLINGNLTATGGFFLGSGALWRPAYAGRDFQVTDGAAVPFGLNFGTVPQFTFKGDNLAPLNTGETYKLYADLATGSGFTPRLRIVTPGTTTAYSLTVDTVPGTGPTRQIDKGANPDASNNIYRLRFQGTFTATAYYEPDGGGGGGGWTKDATAVP